MSDSGILPKILFTTELSAKQLNHLKTMKIDAVVEPLISTEFLPRETWFSAIPNDYDAWVFTSKNAVKAVTPAIDELSIPPYIFAVGEKTAEKLEELSLESIIPEEYNLISLAEKMNNYRFSKLIHFCGNRKAGDLSELLDYAEVISVEVYKTELRSKKIDVQAFQGIVFMSPSAVNAFHQENTIPAAFPVFSIGPSTSKKLEDFEIRDSIQAEKATLESIAETIHNYFKTCPQIN